MRKIDMYVCELCGTKYDSEGYAKQCERSHTKVKSIEDVRYKPFKKEPYAVGIRLEDGSYKVFGDRDQ